MVWNILYFIGLLALLCGVFLMLSKKLRDKSGNLKIKVLQQINQIRQDMES